MKAGKSGMLEEEMLRPQQGALKSTYKTIHEKSNSRQGKLGERSSRRQNKKTKNRKNEGGKIRGSKRSTTLKQTCQGKMKGNLKIKQNKTKKIFQREGPEFAH